jgi:hypothetical protein
MSALTGLANSDGRIPIGVGPVTVFKNAMGFNATGQLVTVNGAGTRYFNGSVSVDAAGAVYTDLVGAIDHYAAGIPLTATDELAAEIAAVVSFDQGVGRTAAGRVALV